MKQLKKLSKNIKKVEKQIPQPLKNLVRQKAIHKMESMIQHDPRVALAHDVYQSVQKFRGSGDYRVDSNSIIKGNYPNSRSLPVFASRNNSIRVREREYIGDVVSASTINTFNVNSYSLNPTNSSTFPWLSSIANLYEQWEPHGIVLEYVSTSADFNGSAQALGSLIMSTDYNALDPPFSTKQIMENAEFSCSTRPSCNLLHGIECATSERPTRLLYTNQDSASMPLNFSTLGNFQIATAGVSAANVTLGELWVTYDISFFKKSIENTTSIPPFFGFSFNTGTTLPFNSVSYNGGNTQGWALTTSVGNGQFIVFPALPVGTKVQLLVYFASGTSAQNPVAITYNGCNLISFRSGEGSNSQPGLEQYLLQTTAASTSLNPVSVLFISGSGTGVAGSFSATTVSSAYAF